MNTKRLIALVCVSIILCFQFSISNLAAAQDTSKVSVKPYGFVRNYLTFDSRKTYTVVGGEYNMIPYDEAWNEDHSEDLNAVPQMQLQALTSRFGLDIQGPQLWHWRFCGKLEGDFGGFGTNNHELRLRLAYIKLKSEAGGRRSEIVIGQDWHPMCGNIMPEVLGMAAGAPFRPHSRTPQIRGTRFWGSFGYTAALLWQLQYMNYGPRTATDPTSVASTDFARQALWPEAFLGLNVKRGPWYLQLGVDAQILMPRTHAADGTGVTHKVDETVKSFSPTLYAQFADDGWSIMFRTLLAQNTSHLNQLVGYAVTGVNIDGSWDYRPLRASVSYLNIAYTNAITQSRNHTFTLNLFLGYMKNLGAGETLYDFGTTDYRVYMKGGDAFSHLNSVYRIAPSVCFNFKPFCVGLEYEWTACTYGELDSDGSILMNDNLHQVANHRLCALVKYNF